MERWGVLSDEEAPLTPGQNEKSPLLGDDWPDSAGAPAAVSSPIGFGGVADNCPDGPGSPLPSPMPAVFRTPVAGRGNGMTARGHKRTVSDPGTLSPQKLHEEANGGDGTLATPARDLFANVGGTPLTRRRQMPGSSQSRRNSRDRDRGSAASRGTATPRDTPTLSRAGSDESFIIRNDATPREETAGDTSIGIDRLAPPPEGPPMYYGLPQKVAFYLAVFVVSAVSVGYDLGIISVAKIKIQDDLKLNNDQVELMTGVLNIASAIGALCVGSMADNMGRRPALLLAGSLRAGGSVLMGFSPTFPMLCIARFIAGLGVGAAIVVGPLYTAEISPAKLRGRLISITILGMNIGIVIGFVTGYALSGLDLGDGWRWMLGLSAAPALVVIALVVLMPESPRWLMGKGRMDEAVAILQDICTPVEAELAALNFHSERSVTKHGAWSTIIRCPKEWRGMVAVGMGVSFFQQATGIEYSTYYTPEILKEAGLEEDGEIFLYTICLGVIKFLMLCLAIGVIDNRLGRRPMLLISGVGMAVSQLCLGFTYMLAPDGWESFLGIVFLGVFMASYAFGFGPVGLVVVSEIFPLQIRGTIMGLAIFLNRLVNALVASTFFSLRDLVGPDGAAFVFGGLSVSAVVFVYSAVPETKHKDLENIEAEMRDHGCCTGGKRRGFSLRTTKSTRRLMY